MTWLFIHTDHSPLKDLNQTIREKTLLFAINKTRKKFSSYTPWMCHVEKLAELSNFFNSSDLILQEEKILTGIAPYYSIKNNNGDSLYPSTIHIEDYKIYKKSSEYLFSIPLLKRTFHSLIEHIVPLASKKGETTKSGAGSSTLLARGAIFLAIPKIGELSTIKLALNMAHELGHQSLMVYQTSDRIIKNDLSTPVYSYIRKEPRPIIQSFHASFALAFMVEFLQKINRNLLTANELKFVKNELKNIKENFKISLKEFDKNKFTDFGAILLGDLESYAKTS